MSSAFRWFLAELLALPEARAARRGRTYAVLDDALENVLFSNAAGRATLGLSPEEPPSPLLIRQIRSGARALREGGTFPFLLRVPTTRAATPITAAATRFATDAGAAVLLTARGAPGMPGEEPHRILAMPGFAENGKAAVFAADGTLAAGSLLPAAGEGFPSELAAFAAAGAAVADAAGGRIRLFRIEDGLILAAVRDAGAPVAEDAPTVRHADPKLRPLRSVWDAPTAAAGPADPESVDERSEEAPACPSDEPTTGPGETQQPVERESVVTLPDFGRGDADAMDPSVSADEEAPFGGDGALVPAADEPGLGVEPTLPPPEPEESADDAQRASDGAGPVFVPRLDAPPVRFVWQIDASGRFRSLSPEFAEAVGPRAAAVVGRTFRDVAADFGFDANGAIQGLLDRRDTWSGRTVLWPVEGTDRRVPIDLAALPTYTRERSFDGFRGFGIVRSTDHEPDEARRGLAFAAARPRAADEPATVAEAPANVRPPKPSFRAFEADLPGVSFGRRQAPPQPPATEQDDGTTGRIVPFVERRRSSESTLSESEEAAFRAIGAKLGRRNEAETPGALRFESLVPNAVDIGAGSDAAPPEAPTPAPAVPPASGDEVPPGESAGEGEELPAAGVEPLLAALPLPVLVRSGDALVFANRAFAEFSGFETLDELVAAGGLDALFAERTAEPASGTMRVRRAGGGMVEAGVHLQRIAFAERSSLLMTFEPTRAEAAADTLRREVGELRAVLDIATDGVVIADPDGDVRAANGSAEALFGMPAADFAGRPLADLFAPESRGTVLDYMETLKDNGLAGIMNDGREVIGRVAQGGFVPLFITLGRVPEERGWCVVMRDMSHWKRIEEELVNAKRAAEAASLHKSRFLANISHELRTPLNAIIGFADVMASECFGPLGNERYVEYLGDIKRSGHHVLDLVNDLLDISKIEAGRMDLTFEAVSLNEVLAEVVATMQPQANRERVIVRSNLPASVPPVVADRRTIRQIALNLLSNSVRFTPAGGQIIASTTYTAEGDVLLRVRDSGIGMSPSEIEIAMTPFQQVHKPDGGGRGTGTGLGLPLTKAMAEANRANFAIRSTPGEGTLVEISFPAQRVLTD
jgi:PAS domain S-box-containing protein